MINNEKDEVLGNFIPKDEIQTCLERRWSFSLRRMKITESWVKINTLHTIVILQRKKIKSCLWPVFYSFHSSQQKL